MSSSKLPANIGRSSIAGCAVTHLSDVFLRGVGCCRVTHLRDVVFCRATHSCGMWDNSFAALLRFVHPALAGHHGRTMLNIKWKANKSPRINPTKISETLNKRHPTNESSHNPTKIRMTNPATLHKKLTRHPTNESLLARNWVTPWKSIKIVCNSSC